MLWRLSFPRLSLDLREREGNVTRRNNNADPGPQATMPTALFFAALRAGQREPSAAALQMLLRTVHTY